MTALPEPWRLLNIAEYEALGEDDQVHWELQEGILVMSPSPRPRHNVVGGLVFNQVRQQLPPELIAVPDVDINLELVPDDEPATVRRPDLVVVDSSEYERVEDEGGTIRAACVHIVVEIVSPGSRRMDYKIKRSEYADAGIPNYWIIDLTRPISLLSLRLTDELGYVDDGEMTGTYTTTSPCPLTIQLNQLDR
ncbi:Uma2 family endonuclease [Nocardia pseudovaccinii]|uniref:Uma2 family endonuclease n=1 Tax=Nocardia pseudovaccinii TaxID=189540 RepID=UPI0007A38311|nr:Uma2 family endonuclease [Nocardia pseudovaccinii]